MKDTTKRPVVTLNNHQTEFFNITEVLKIDISSNQF